MTGPRFWDARRVFVTGHTGFKGAWLALWLSARGARVTGYALPPPTTPNLFTLADVGGRVASHAGDVRELERLRAVMTSCAPEIVFHFAAQSLVRESYRDPVDTFATNVLGTVNCLEAVRACKTVRAVVVATTDKCYENPPPQYGYCESDRLGGEDPYAASKAAAELATAAYRKCFLPAQGVATVRAGNVVGGGDWAPERLVPDAMRAFAAAQPLKVRNPQFTRPWQHVLEPLRGYLMLAERLYRGANGYAEAWNFGPAARDARPVAWLADQLAARWGRGATWEPQSAGGPGEAKRLTLDATKAAQRLGWSPKLDLDTALDWVVEWYDAHARDADVGRLALEQIARYERLS